MRVSEIDGSYTFFNSDNRSTGLQFVAKKFWIIATEKEIGTFVNKEDPWKLTNNSIGSKVSTLLINFVDILKMRMILIYRNETF